MSDDLLDDPRIRELVEEARKAQALKERVSEDDRPQVEEALAGLLRDLGASVLALDDQREGRPFLPVDDEMPAHQGEKFTDELPEGEDAGSWYTDEREKPDSGPKLFDDGDLEDYTEVPESDPRTPERAPDRHSPEETTDADSRFEVETIDGLEALKAQAGSAIALLDIDNAPTWRHHVDELLDLLALPSDFEDSDELAVEASRVQWATNELQPRLTGLPEEIQAAIIGMLAARAQHLRGRLDVDVGPRLSLDRLQRYRITEDLPMVHGLLPTPRPEHGTWDADVRRWWTLLRPRGGAS